MDWGNSELERYLSGEKTVTVTLRSLLGGLILPDRTRIVCTGDAQGGRWSFSKGKGYLVYTSKGSNRVYDDYNKEWSLKTAESIDHFNDILQVEFTVPARFKSKFQGRDRHKFADFARAYGVSQKCWDRHVSDMGFLKSLALLDKETNTTVKEKKMSELERKINGEKEDVKLVQKLKSKKVIEVDLVSVLEESPTFQSLMFGKERLLSKLECDGKVLICHTTEGKVEVGK